MWSWAGPAHPYALQNVAKAWGSSGFSKWTQWTGSASTAQAGPRSASQNRMWLDLWLDSTAPSGPLMIAVPRTRASRVVTLPSKKTHAGATFAEREGRPPASGRCRPSAADRHGPYGRRQGACRGRHRTSSSFKARVSSSRFAWSRQNRYRCLASDGTHGRRATAIPESGDRENERAVRPIQVLKDF